METATPLTLQVVLALVALGGQAAMFAYFLGKMRGANDLFTAQIATVTAAITALQSFREDTVGDGADLHARLAAVERSHATFDALRVEFIAHRATSAAQHVQHEDALARVSRQVENVHSQVAALARERLVGDPDAAAAREALARERAGVPPRG